jgi:hypothetical protein
MSGLRKQIDCPGWWDRKRRRRWPTETVALRVGSIISVPLMRSVDVAPSPSNVKCR